MTTKIELINLFVVTELGLKVILFTVFNEKRKSV